MQWKWRANCLTHIASSLSRTMKVTSASISEPQKIGEGINAYVSYKFSIQVRDFLRLLFVSRRPVSL